VFTARFVVPRPAGETGLDRDAQDNVFRKIYMLDETGQGRLGDELGRLLAMILLVRSYWLRRKRIMAVCRHASLAFQAQTVCRCHAPFFRGLAPHLRCAQPQWYATGSV
jgi:hypothetical protein